MASFRGVEFYIDAAAISGGRRVVVHEYPLRNVPFVEDMGRAARGYSFACYVLGADYAAQRDDLIKALEAPGAGILLHPDLGQIRASVVSYDAGERDDERRIVRFQIRMVEDGANNEPRARADTQSALLRQVGTSRASLISAFAEAADLAFSGVDGFDAGAAAFADVLGFVSGIPGLSDRAAVLLFVSDALGLSLPSGMIGAIFDLARLVSPPPVGSAAARVSQRRLAAILSGPVAGTAAPLPGVAVRPADRAAHLVSAALRSAVAVEYAAAQPFVIWPDRDDALKYRATFLGILSGEVTAAADGFDDAAFQALRDIESAGLLDVDARAASLSPLIGYEAAASVPSLAVAYNSYANPDRAPEVADRLAAIHPLFLPHSGLIAAL